jgi:hypothetical protein
MLFFDEEFGKVHTMVMDEKNALGWSATFMKQGLALMLLLFYEGAELPAGLRAMSRRAALECGFKTAEYIKGTGLSIEMDDDALFWDLFSQWKNNVQIAEGETEQWLSRIDQWIALRVEGIMNNNRRDYYGECASYIAGLGEVWESLGIQSAKARIMEKYKSAYSRRTAFHKALRTYGMQKQK